MKIALTVLIVFGTFSLFMFGAWYTGVDIFERGFLQSVSFLISLVAAGISYFSFCDR